MTPATRKRIVRMLEAGHDPADVAAAALVSYQAVLKLARSGGTATAPAVVEAPKTQRKPDANPSPQPPPARRPSTTKAASLSRAGAPPGPRLNGKPGERAKRKCLGCGLSFDSSWIGNRLCRSCSLRASSGVEA